MIYVLYGAAGVIGVLLLLLTGVWIGWKGRVAYEKHNTRVVEETMTEEQRQQFLASQRAFDAMLHYNSEQAYGLNRSLDELARE